MKVCLQWIFTAVLALTSLAGHAQAVTNPAKALLPTRGLWLSDAKPNHGWTFDVTPTGFMFVTIFTYDPDGRPTFLTAQGQYLQTPGDPSGNMGRLESPVFRTAGGAPIDSLAPGNAAAVAVGNAVITFQSGRRATWTMGANTFQLNSFQDFPGIDGGFKVSDLIVGKWMLVQFSEFSGVTDYFTTYITFTEVGGVSGKRTFDAVCNSRCLVQTSPDRYVEQGAPAVAAATESIRNLRVTYDPLTGALRSESKSATQYQSFNRDLLVVSPNEIQGRALLGATGQPTDGQPLTGIDRRGLRLVRLPPDFRFDR